MGIAEGYRRAAEQRKERLRDFVARLDKAGLSACIEQDFEITFVGARPRTTKGWEIYSSLLEREGQLDEAARAEVRHGLESIQIHERVAEIRKRLESGEQLPDPIWTKSSPPIPARVALSVGAMSIVEWEAIKQLGLEKDSRYHHVYHDAMIELYRISSERGDVLRFFESLRQTYKRSSAAEQEPVPPVDFREVKVVLPFSVLKRSVKLEVIRYHPRYGLVCGTVSKFRYYDRGAGGFPVGQGAWVRTYQPAISLLSQDVVFRNCAEVSKRSVWFVTGEPPLIVARDRPNQKIEAAFHYAERFDNLEDAKRFLIGEIESDFVRETLPVIVQKLRAAYILHFQARPLNR